MAGGPLYPISAFPLTTDRTFENVHNIPDDTDNAVWNEIGMGVEASVGADSTWQLVFEMPPTPLPSGTGKLRLRAQADAATGVAKVNPTWASVAVEESPGLVSKTAETVQDLTWAAGDENVYKELKVTLNADTLVASEFVVIDLIFETSSWTLAAISTWYASIIWE